MTNPTFILPSSPGIAANNLYALKVGNQPERFSPISGTFARSTTASRQNANGLIESIAINTPRLDYTYGSCPALLLEPQRTNLVVQSNTFNTTWAMFTGPAVTPNSTTSPDGSTNATTLNSSGGTNDFLFQTLSGLTIGTTYTFSFYIKNLNSSASRAWGPTASISIADMSWSGSTLVSVSGTGNSFTSIGNGWYRVIMTGSAATAILNMRIYADANNTSKSVYIYGAQLEAGAYPTTYIPTTSATVTRTADSFSYSNIYTNGYVSSQGGTWLIELKNNVSYTRDSAIGLFINQNSSSTQYGFHIVSPGTGRLSIRKLDSTGNTAIYTTTKDTTKIAIKWNGTTADIFENGTKVISSTAFTPLNMEFLAADNRDVPKYIQQMALFNTPLPDSECILLTSDTYGTFATLASSTSYTLS